MSLRIALLVHGRFHAFDLARALIERGHRVTVFTNYPGWAAERFGIPRTAVRSFLLHGALSRASRRIQDALGLRSLDDPLHTLFGRWGERQLRDREWDVIHCWSGISEESLRSARVRPFRVLMRGSAHIRVQDRILEEEQRRCGVRIERPSRWMIEREEREYRLADRIRVLSAFAQRTFLEQGIDPSKLWLIPSGVPVRQFRPPAADVEARCARLLSGAPLRVLYVGALSYRKGIYDLAEIARAGGNRQFRFVGPALPEARPLLARIGDNAEILPAEPQARLAAHYRWADLFLFPTLEDSYPNTLAQAYASGLPALTTPNCSAPDFIRHGENGWLLPARDPAAFLEQLSWCDSHRGETAEVVRRIYDGFRRREWSEAARDFEARCLSELRPGGPAV